MAISITELVGNHFQMSISHWSIAIIEHGNIYGIGKLLDGMSIFVNNNFVAI